MPEPELDLSQDARVTHYGYDDDPTPDSNSLAGIGNHDNKLIPGSLGFSPDLIDRYNLQHDDPVDIQFPDGTIFHGTYGDQTADEYQGRKIRNTVDIYDPYKYFSDEDLNQAKIVVRPKSRVKRTASVQDQTVEQPTEPAKPEPKDPPTFIDKFRDKFPIYKNKDAFSDGDLARMIRQKYGYGNITEDLFIDEATRHDNGKGLSEEIDSKLSGIDRIRRKYKDYPLYQDMSDEDLLRGLWGHHPELQKEDFDTFYDRMKPPSPTVKAIQNVYNRTVDAFDKAGQKATDEGLASLSDFWRNVEDVATKSGLAKSLNAIGDALNLTSAPPPNNDSLWSGFKKWLGGLVENAHQNAEAYRQQAGKDPAPDTSTLSGKVGAFAGEISGGVLGNAPYFLPWGATAKTTIAVNMALAGTNSAGEQIQRWGDASYLQTGIDAGVNGLSMYLLGTPNGRLVTGLAGGILDVSSEKLKAMLEGKDTTLEDDAKTAAKGFLNTVLFKHVEAEEPVKETKTETPPREEVKTLPQPTELEASGGKAPSAEEPAKPVTLKPKRTPMPESAKVELKRAQEAKDRGDENGETEAINRTLGLLPEKKKAEVARDVVELVKKTASRKKVDVKRTKDAVEQVEQVAKKTKKTKPTEVAKRPEPEEPVTLPKPKAKAPKPAGAPEPNEPIDTDKFLQTYRTMMALKRGGRSVSIAAIRDRLGVTQSQIESFIRQQTRTGNISIHPETTTSKDPHLLSGAIHLPTESEPLVNFTVNRGSKFDSKLIQLDPERPGEPNEPPKPVSAKPETPVEEGPAEVTQLENGRWRVKLTMPDGKEFDQTFGSEEAARKSAQGLNKYYHEYQFEGSDLFDDYHFGAGDPLKMFNDWVIRAWPVARRWTSRLPGIDDLLDWHDKWLQSFNPGYRSREAMIAEGVLRGAVGFEKAVLNQYGNEIARNEALDERLGGANSERRFKFWDKYTAKETVDLLAKFQKGQSSGDPDVDRMFRFHRAWMDGLNQGENAWGIRYEKVKEYIQGAYKTKRKAEEAMRRFVLRYPDPSIVKPKEFQNFLEAEAAGYHLKHYNLEKIDQLRTATSMFLIGQIKALDHFVDLGLAYRRGDGQGPEDWKEIRAANGDWYKVHPHAALPFERRYDPTPAIWNSWASPLIKTAQILKGVGSKMKLTWGLFHPIHVATIHAGHNLSQDLWMLLATGKTDPKRLAADLFDTATLGLRHLHAGSAPERVTNVFETMLGDRSLTRATPEERLMIKQLMETGFSPNVSHERAMEWAHNITNTFLPKSGVAKGMAKAAELTLHWASIEPFNRYIFEKTIPLMKAQATLSMVNDLLTVRPELNDPKFARERAIAMRDIGRTIDGRYGEMNYDTLFWDKNFKTLGITSLLSLGWKLSLFRVYGGAVHDMINNAVYLDERIKQMRALGKDGHATVGSTAAAFLTRDILNAVVYSAIGMVANAVLTRLTTGKNPEEFNDYFFPVIGYDPQGNKKRVHTMFFPGELVTIYNHYAREGWFNGTTSLLKNWLSPGLGTAADVLVYNKDYQGRQITSFNKYDKDVNVYSDILKYVVKNMFAPISTESAYSAYKSGSHNPAEYILPFVGLSPAPAWTQRSTLDESIVDTWAEEHGGGTKLRIEQETDDLKAQLKEAVKNKDTRREAEIGQQLLLKGVSEKTIKTAEKSALVPTAMRLLNQINPSRQVNILESMSPKDLEKYYPHASKKARELFDEYLKTQKKKKIPHMQEGGVVTEPTTALVGESGPEAIIPLNDPSKAEVVTKPTVTTVGTKGPEAVVPVSDLNKGALGGANWGTVGSTVAQGDPDWTELDKKMLRFQLSRADRLSPTSGRHQVDPLSEEADIDPDYTIPHPFHEQKGGIVREQFPGRDFDETMKHSAPRPGDTYENEAPQEDTLLPDPGYKSRFTSEEDFHQLPYNYGDKLPQNRGIPIPLESLMNPELSL